MGDARDPNPRRLAVLVGLEARARAAATAEELGFVAVNETVGLVPYRQAALWRGAGGRGRVAALSGLSAPDRHAPYVVWLEGVLGAVGRTGRAAEAHAFGAADVPGAAGAQWAQWLPAHALWLPLAVRGTPTGALVLAREEPWTDAERSVLGVAADAFAHALAALEGPRRRSWSRPGRRRMLAAAAVAGLAAAGFLPVRESALAPAEVVPRDPAAVRAPLDGVVDRVLVRPNQPVRAGDLLLALDPRRLRNRLEVARVAAEVAEAELRQANQLAVEDARARASVPVLRGRLEQQRAEAAYLEDLLQRVEIRAPADGVAVLDDADEWVGRPVALGERILLVADPARVALEIRLPVADAIRLEPGADVDFFLNVDPQAPAPARLVFASYGAAPGPDGTLAYRLEAEFADGAPPLRIGLGGTAKVYGGRVSLAYHVFRRPLAALRRWVGA
jgi:multidrug resistance efflux pump